MCLGNKNHFDNDIFYFGMQPFDITGEEMPTALTKLRKSKYGKYHDNHKFINETLVIMQCLCIYKAYLANNAHMRFLPLERVIYKNVQHKTLIRIICKGIYLLIKI